MTIPADTGYRQAKWNTPTLFEQGVPGRVGHAVPKPSQEAESYGSAALAAIPANMRRTNLGLPGLSELDVVRHYSRLASKNFGVDSGTYPLGSCTMKLNPKVNEVLAAHPGVRYVHPLQD